MKKLPKKPVFAQEGLKGFKYPLESSEVEVYYVDVTQGHDTYIISKRCFHIYYVLKGEGVFDIRNRLTKVSKGDLIEVLPSTEYTYSGNMRLLLIMNPPWFEGNEKVTKRNPNVRM